MEGVIMKKITGIFVILILVLCSLSACDNGAYVDGYADGYDAGYRAAHAADATESEMPTLATQPEPENGYIFEDIQMEKTAPLAIETFGTGGYYFVLDPIQLYIESDATSFEKTRAEMNADYTYLKFYAVAGSAVDIPVPLGEYEIYYATGDVWYGEGDLFGADTVYHKCDDTFLFTIEDGQCSGWTIELMPVPNGNLNTEVIDAEDFP